MEYNPWSQTQEKATTPNRWTTRERDTEDIGNISNYIVKVLK